jgi:signal transduction histidine kinase
LFFGHPEVAVFTDRTERLIAGVAAQAAIAIDNARLYEAAQQAAQERELLLASERAARSEAERMSSMKDEFLTTLSHELRTPLGAILGWSQILRRGTRNEADLNKGLETIERNARGQAQLIEDLLDMSRITAGKVRLDVQVVELSDLIETSVETVRPTAEAKGIQLAVVLDPCAGAVSGDPGRLQQIIWNLLSNAIKFTPKHGQVQVTLARVDSHIEISVSDTGAGIREEFLAHVFERFRQADGSTTRQFGGLGLGLSIVKSLTEMHGGRVYALSPGLGMGATFTVELPLPVFHGALPGSPGPHSATPHALASPTFQFPDLGGLTVVVVDDERDSRDLVRRVLEDCSAIVLCAASAAEAIALVEQYRPHVLVSDIGMPGVDGYELLRRVRALGADRGGRIPAIALTAFARSEDRTKALHVGYLAHVAKPVEPAELAITVASVAGRTG